MAHCTLTIEAWDVPEPFDAAMDHGPDGAPPLTRGQLAIFLRGIACDVDSGHCAGDGYVAQGRSAYLWKMEGLEDADTANS